jgi:acyl-CoA thioesterase-2
MVVGQAVVAAGRTVSDRLFQSLHAYFLRPAKHVEPIHFHVSRLRDGATFATRSVLARQSGEPVFNLMATFGRPEDGISHHDRMPEAPDPGGLPEWEDLRAALLGDLSKRRRDGPVEVRVCDPDSPDPTVRLPARRRVWLRPRGTLPDDPLLHAAVLAYASDRTLLRTAARPHGEPWRLRVAASLDHAMWLHRPARFDDWLLYVVESPVAHGARALVVAAIYRRDGIRVATVAQEGLLRW